MTRRLALKQLTSSDLTIFKWHMDQHESTSKQKAINLNANVLVDILYPNLPDLIDELQGSVPLDLHLYGPGLAGDLNLQRKVQKKGSYKNYRLNGEVIADPEDEPDRFHSLRPSDFVILEFIGDLAPVSARVVFIAQALESDQVLHRALSDYLGSNKMSAISTADLERITAAVNLPIDHPANLLLLEGPLEDAALGGIEGIRTLRSSPYRGRISRQTLEQAKKNAQKTGREGEEMGFIYLEQKRSDGLISDVTWDAEENAIAPYDFTVIELDGSSTFIDAKSTKSDFTNPIHISYNELLKMADGESYKIYRIYDLSETGAKLRITENDLCQFSETIRSIFDGLPPEIHPDGISLSPSALTFGEEIEITIPNEEN
jgi:hypothetical protein